MVTTPLHICLYEIVINSYFPKSVSALPTLIMGGGTATAPANPIHGDEVVLPTGHNGRATSLLLPPATKRSLAVPSGMASSA